MDITSGLTGLTFTAASLYDQLAQQGWEVKKLHFDKGSDKFVAVGKASHGEEIEGRGPSERVALSNLLYHVMHRNHTRSSKLSMWTHTFTDQLPAIAEAYSKAPVYDPKAAASFMELAADSVRRADSLRQHLEITLTNNPNPYTGPDKMHEDVRKRRQLEVSRANLEHPIWSTEQALAYRICHDVLGYCAAGAGWDWQGENQAFAAHAAVLPEEAQKALFAESIGQSAYATYYQAYGPQKVAAFPEFMDEAQGKENPHKGYRGQLPDESHVPVERPQIKPVASVYGPGGLDPTIDVELPQEGVQRVSAVNTGLMDPNAGWQSGVQPMQPNAYLDYRDPTTGQDPLQSQAVLDTAKLIDTEWARLNQEDPNELATMKRAIVNAFRVVLLSPRKDLRWNAIHYQHIANVPGDEDNPDVYWDTLEKNRQEWNVKRFGEDARLSHRPYWKPLKQLTNLMYKKNPTAGWDAAQQESDALFHRMHARLQEQVMAEDQEQPEEKQSHMYQIDNEANKRFADWLKTYLKEGMPGMDVESAVTTPVDPDVDGPGETPDMSRYGAFMGSHLKAIAQISQHVDEILKAALEDVHNHDGSGHHFRSVVLQLGVSGVGPKVCSFAWLLLQPMTSQLGTIDTHMMDVLGYNFEKDMSNRDYFKFERELQAGRDAAGYGHVPLGTFQWGMWDLKRTGAGSHQDHSAMKVLDPKPFDQIDWAKKEQPINAEQAQAWKANWLTNAPEWWQATAPARQAVADDWDQNVASNVAKTKIPYNLAPEGVLSRVSMQWDDSGNLQSVYQVKPNEVSYSTLVPWFKHPDTGAQIQGAPGTTLMQHARSVLGGDPWDIWQKLPDDYAGKV
jgi:hypothetical protein